MIDIYTNNKLKYPLDANEYGDIDSVWNLINIFAKPFLHVTDYRNFLLKTIKRYSITEFYHLETIINKLFWNLRWIMFIWFINPQLNEKDYNLFIQDYGNHKEIPNSLTMCNKINYADSNDLERELKKINLNTFYRSFINKLIIIDKSNKVIYYRDMEGSADIFNKNNFNLLTMTILLDRNLYEKVMSNPYKYKNLDIELSQYYYQYDYGFPNLNYCIYDFGNEEYKKHRIEKMYHEKDAKYWFKIIK